MAKPRRRKKKETYNVKCPECETEFVVEASDSDEDDVWECPECEADVECTFYGGCPQCEELVGFCLGSDEEVLGDIATNIAKGAVKSVLDPLQAVGSLAGRFLDEIPDGKWGQCTVCETHCVVCPRCGAIQEWVGSEEGNEPVKCINCKRKFRHP